MLRSGTRTGHWTGPIARFVSPRRTAKRGSSERIGSWTKQPVSAVSWRSRSACDGDRESRARVRLISVTAGWTPEAFRSAGSRAKGRCKRRIPPPCGARTSPGARPARASFTVRPTPPTLHRPRRFVHVSSTPILERFVRRVHFCHTLTTRNACCDAGCVRVDHSCPSVSGVGTTGSSPVPPIPAISLQEWVCGAEAGKRRPRRPGELDGSHHRRALDVAIPAGPPWWGRRSAGGVYEGRGFTVCRRRAAVSSKEHESIRAVPTPGQRTATYSSHVPADRARGFLGFVWLRRAQVRSAMSPRITDLSCGLGCTRALPPRPAPQQEQERAREDERERETARGANARVAPVEPARPG